MTTNPVVTRLELDVAVDLLQRETLLLDERRLEEWLELFTEDGIYWVPIDETSDPKREPSLFFDDSLLRQQRVHQVLHLPRYAQMPPSRTTHILSHIRVVPDTSEGEAVVACNMAVIEVRPGEHKQLQRGLGTQSVFAGSCEYRLRHSEGSGWRIAMKKVLLLNRDLSFQNLSIII